MLALILLLIAVFSPSPARADAALDQTLHDIGHSISRTWDKAARSTEEFLGMGDTMRAVIHCSDPDFSVIKEKNRTNGDEYLILKGILHTPHPGFGYQYRFLGWRGQEAFMQLDTGMIITPQYRQPPQPGEIAVQQQFTLPPMIRLVHIRVTGLSAQPYNFLCTILPPPRE